MTNYIYSFVFLFFLHQCFHDSDPVNPVKVSLKEKWASDTTLKTPESVLYDGTRKLIFVSNINRRNPIQKDGDGFISLLKINGEIKNLKWITGLNDPKGSRIKNKKLYVADLNELVEIDIPTAKIVKRYLIPEAKFLNDVTIDWQGNVYVSDSQGNKIYQLKNNIISVFAEGPEILGPNGLFAEKDRLVVGLSSIGEVKSIDYATKALSPGVSGIPSTDGITKDLRHNYFVSNWNGEIYYVQRPGEKEKVLDTKAAGINSADIDFMENGNILLVPTFFNNRVVAYQIRYE